MKKLLRGIAEFRRTRREGDREAFARLALGQRPDALLIACADSRVAPNVFASVEPGDLLVVRNVGNLVPAYAEPEAEQERTVASVPAAIELAMHAFHVRDVVVCGHSECTAMQAILTGRVPEGSPHLAAWLRHGAPVLGALPPPPPGLAPHNHLSQQSVVQQVEHLRTYPGVSSAESAGRLRLHAWWFDIAKGEVLDWERAAQRFVTLDEARVARLLGSSG